MLLSRWKVSGTFLALGVVLAVACSSVAPLSATSAPGGALPEGSGGGVGGAAGAGTTAPRAGAVATAQDQSPAGGIRVQGSGSVSLKPDAAMVELGAAVVHPTVDAAIKEVTDRINAVDKFLGDSGIAEADIQTLYFNVGQEPAYPPRTGPDGTSVMVYRATHIQRIMVRDIGKVGPLIQGAVNAGANSVQAVNFVVSDPTPHLRQARERAMQDARDRASQLANLAGVQLGPVVSISEMPGPFPPLAGGAGAEKAAYIQPGTTSLTVSLEVVFSIR